MFQQVVHKGGESSINYIKIFQIAKDLEILLRNSYTEYQQMKNFSDNLRKGGNYFAQIEIHHTESRKEETIIDQKSLSIYDLQMDYLNLDNSVRNNGREHFS